ncbi:SHOCT domain-containing protein [Tenacibaculum sp.]|uniref:SHOCT domain-containing protein n=1 Tax=Tenacibaculum sp. TaxID=1906242 RepID=UPI003D0E386F
MMWLIWIPLIVLIVLLVPKLNTTNQFTKKESPLEILKRRYANGEITTEEYEQIKKVLEK